jgi:hypothetical protein
MSDGGNDILIIKRHGGHEEEHHGGAWKIAFADFMTAMMAFFLVLWIVNSTNKETRTVIARYFNPVKLEDLSRSKKGIRDDKEKNVAGDASGPGSDKGQGGTAAPSAVQKTTAEGEAALIANPSDSLDAIVAKARRQNARLRAPTASPILSRRRDRNPPATRRFRRVALRRLHLRRTRRRRSRSVCRRRKAQPRSLPRRSRRRRDRSRAIAPAPAFRRKRPAKAY